MNEFKNDWLQHPSTKDLVKVLRGLIVEAKDQWAAGVFTAESSEGTAQKNARALGAVDVCEQIVEYILSKEES
jgi:hypothetical protein